MVWWEVVLLVCVQQQTAYELRISDWSADVCSSDLRPPAAGGRLTGGCRHAQLRGLRRGPGNRGPEGAEADGTAAPQPHALLLPGRGRAADARKSVVSGKRVSVRVDLGGRRIIKINTHK